MADERTEPPGEPPGPPAQAGAHPPPDAGSSPHRGSMRAQFFGHFTAANFSSPYPPPEVLAAYDDAVPGLSKQIIKQVELESQHRREVEKHRQEAAIADRKAARVERQRGQYLGFLIGVAGLTASVLIAYFGHPGAAGTVGVTTVISLVSVFVIGRRSAEQKQSGKGKEAERTLSAQSPESPNPPS